MDLKGLALSVVILVITVSIGTKITATVRDTFNNTTSTEYLNADSGVTALGDFSDWYSIIIITGVGAAVLGMLGMFNKAT